MLRVFTSDLRIENAIFIMVSLIATVALAQFGGMPTPKLGSLLGLTNWALWMVAVCVQWFSTLLSLVMVAESYMLFASESRECMVPFTEDSELGRLDVIAGMTFFVQPIFLVKQLVMWFYMIVGTEGTKVFARTRAWTWAMGANVPTLYGICCGVDKFPIDATIFINYFYVAICLLYTSPSPRDS